MSLYKEFRRENIDEPVFRLMFEINASCTSEASSSGPVQYGTRISASVGKRRTTPSAPPEPAQLLHDLVHLAQETPAHATLQKDRRATCRVTSEPSSSSRPAACPYRIRAASRVSSRVAGHWARHPTPCHVRQRAAWEKMPA